MTDVDLETEGGPMAGIATFRGTGLWDTDSDEGCISSNEDDDDDDDDDDEGSDCSPGDDAAIRVHKRRRTKQRENFGVHWEAHHDRNALE